MLTIANGYRPMFSLRIENTASDVVKGLHRTKKGGSNELSRTLLDPLLPCIIRLVEYWKFHDDSLGNICLKLIAKHIYKNTKMNVHP